MKHVYVVLSYDSSEPENTDRQATCVFQEEDDAKNWIEKNTREPECCYYIAKLPFHSSQHTTNALNKALKEGGAPPCLLQ